MLLTKYVQSHISELIKSLLNLIITCDSHIYVWFFLSLLLMCCAYVKGCKPASRRDAWWEFNALRNAESQGSHPNRKPIRSSGTGIVTDRLEISHRNMAFPVCMYLSQVTVHIYFISPYLILFIFIDSTALSTDVEQNRSEYWIINKSSSLAAKCCVYVFADWFSCA